ncbi:unnamed protein product [Malus baccata var. baccata]
MNYTIGSKTFARTLVYGHMMQQRVVVGGCNDPLSELRSVTVVLLVGMGGCENWLSELGSRTTASLTGIDGKSRSDKGRFGEEDTPELRTHVYVEAKGSETRNKVRGYGHGVTPEMVSYACSSAASSSRKSSTDALDKLLSENNELGKGRKKLLNSWQRYKLSFSNHRPCSNR